MSNLIESLELVNLIVGAMNKYNSKTQKEYYLLNKYEILVVGETKKIIQKRKNPDDPIRFLVPYEQIFDTMYRIHIQVGRKCRDIMLDECNKSNITVDMITGIFLFFKD